VEIMTSGGPAHVVLDRPAGEPAFVIALTQPYRVKGARAPGSAARQDTAWTEVIAALAAETGAADVPLVQGGRSNGARVVCRTAKAVGAVGVIALAFPLHPPANPGRSRDGELREAGTRTLVVNGDRDPFGIPAADTTTSVVVLPGETHALSRNPAAVGVAVADWLAVIGLLAAWLRQLGQAAGAW
jgi:predicted alpha/beta-hydrolase family hydrolase